MHLETIDKLYLELSTISTAKTAKEIALEATLKRSSDICRSMHAIVERKGEETNWEAFSIQLEAALLEQHKILHPEAYEISDEGQWFLTTEHYPPPYEWLWIRGHGVTEPTKARWDRVSQTWQLAGPRGHVMADGVEWMDELSPPSRRTAQK